MNVLEFTALVGVGALAAGFLGALTGLGGGVVIVPLLVLMGVDIKYAAGASLISVIATSSGAAASYVKEGYSNIRIGMFLEIATTLGALTGAYLANIIPTQTLLIIFGIVLLISAYLSLRTLPRQHGTEAPDPLATRLHLDSSYPLARGVQPYHVHRVPLGFGLMYLAGCISGLLGIGSGAFKVLAMDQAMRIPFKVSTTTSNFMIGVTAAASAGVYLHHGQINPALTMPVMLGVLIGSLLGARVLMGAQTRLLRRVFSAVILVMAVQMIYKGFTGKLEMKSHQPWQPGPSDERVEGVIGNLLRIGVIASALVVFSGGLLYLIRDGGQPAPDLHHFKPEQLHNPPQIVHEAAELRPLGLIMLGLLLLVATPVARVIFSVAAFALQRDYMYVVFTLLVLAVLMYSLLSGYLGGAGAL